jgi:ornithine carbamoyltransferase
MKTTLTLENMKKNEIIKMIKLAIDIKTHPKKYSTKLKNKIYLMIFEKPSLRTRCSFDVAIKSMSGDTTILDTQQMPLGKESIEDTAKVSSRYYDGIIARMFKHEDIKKLQENSSVPVINGLTNEHHPVQILSDLMTIYEKVSSFDVKLCFLGDGNNNIVHSLLLGCAIMDIEISIGCPKKAMPKKELIKKAKKLTLKPIIITTNPEIAIKNADIIYADSWMSYHIPKSEMKKRIKLFKPYQINKKIIKYACKDYIFMNCLPAMRGYEQTTEIIDGKQSIVFDQAENRLHMQKALLISK